MFYVVGLVVCYIAWGFFQERIMTQPYTSSIDGKKNKFTQAEFLVLCNRLLALAVGYIGLMYTGPYENFAPPFSYSFCSMSNILSSWFQYEALKFITFPMQVVAKSTKIIATMTMGYFLNGKSFTRMEIFNAIVITLGLVVFKFGQSQGGTDDEELSDYFLLGMVLISCYIICDSFTSNWQSRVYSTYSVGSLQMMVGINAFSTCYLLLL
eukprot:UN29492